MSDIIREELCEDCRAKYDKGEAFYFCEKCKKVFEPEK